MIEERQQMNAVGKAWVRTVRAADMPQLKALAQADGHEAAQPTHVFVRRRADGSEELLGCVSIASVPLVLPWFDSKRCQDKESHFFMALVENLVAEVTRPQQKWMCVPVAKESPFAEVMGWLGYIGSGEYTLGFKRLKD